MTTLFTTVLLVEALICLYLLRGGAKRYNRLYQKFIELRQKHRQAHEVIYDLEETLSCMEEELDVANEEIIELRKKLNDMTQEVKKIKDENLAMSIEFQKFNCDKGVSK